MLWLWLSRNLPYKAIFYDYFDVCNFLKQNFPRLSLNAQAHLGTNLLKVYDLFLSCLTPKRRTEKLPHN